MKIKNVILNIILSIHYFTKCCEICYDCMPKEHIKCYADLTKFLSFPENISCS